MNEKKAKKSFQQKKNRWLEHGDWTFSEMESQDWTEQEKEEIQIMLTLERLESNASLPWDKRLNTPSERELKRQFESLWEKKKEEKYGLGKKLLEWMELLYFYRFRAFPLGFALVLLFFLFSEPKKPLETFWQKGKGKETTQDFVFRIAKSSWKQDVPQQMLERNEQILESSWLYFSLQTKQRKGYFTLFEWSEKGALEKLYPLQKKASVLLLPNQTHLLKEKNEVLRYLAKVTKTPQFFSFVVVFSKQPKQWKTWEHKKWKPSTSSEKNKEQLQRLWKLKRSEIFLFPLVLGRKR